ncbi:MAG: tRNA(Ile)-lysidine synthase [Glaciecola sp.]
MDHLSKVQSFWRISYDKWFKVWEVTDDVHFYVSDILSKGEESFLSYYLNEIGFSHSDVKDLFVKNEAHHTGAVLLSKGHKLWYDRGEWVLSKKIETGFSRRYFLNDSKLPLSLSYSLKTVDLSTKIPTSKLVSWVDKTKVNGELFVKRWEQGDVFYPLGMSNKKKLSDYFIDNKISRRDKEKIWLLCDEKSIIWIIGNRLDNRYKVTDKTKDIIEFKVKV